MKASIFAALITTLTFIHVAWGEDDKRKAAGRIADLIHQANAIEENHSKLLDRVEAELISRGNSKEAAGEVRKTMDDWFKGRYRFQAIREEVVDMYASEFSAQELEEMAQFYSTPTGQKALQKMAILGEKAAAMAERILAQDDAVLRQQIKVILEKYGKPAPTSPQ